MVKGLLGAAPYLIGALDETDGVALQSIQLSETAVEAYRPHAVVNLTELAVRVSCLEWENSTATARRVTPGGRPRSMSSAAVRAAVPLLAAVGGGVGDGLRPRRRRLGGGRDPRLRGGGAAKAGDGPLVAALLARFASVNSIDGKRAAYPRQ